MEAGSRRTGSVKAVVICEINILDQKVFTEIRKEYPEFERKMIELTIERRKFDILRSDLDDKAKEKQLAKLNSKTSMHNFGTLGDTNGANVVNDKQIEKVCYSLCHYYHKLKRIIFNKL
jgi:hypothetical protein